MVSDLRAGEPESLWEDAARPGRRQAAALIQSAAPLVDRAPAEAAQVLERAVALDPSRADGFYLLGTARYRERAWVACADALTMARRLDPTIEGTPASSVDDMLGLCLFMAARYDAGVAHYRRMLLAPPAGRSLDVLHGNLADCYLALGRLDESVAELNSALALAPRRSLLWYALAVALDRDERVEQATAAMSRALELDPQLAELGSPDTFYAPPEDAFYYRGLAHQVAAEGDASRRAAAIAHFRRYLALAPSGPWSERARRHLGELGPTALDARDVVVQPREEVAAGAGLVAALPDLQRCLEGQPHVAIRLTLTFAGPAKDRRPAPETGLRTLYTLGPIAASPEVNGCIEKRLNAARTTARRMTRLVVVLISR